MTNTNIFNQIDIGEKKNLIDFIERIEFHKQNMQSVWIELELFTFIDFLYLLKKK